MDLDLDEGIAVLERTPAVLRALLLDLPGAWTHRNEGPDTWSPFDVVGHLIDGEETDWLVRVRHLLAHGESRPFEPFDRRRHLALNGTRTLGELLDRFATLRAENLDALRALNLSRDDLRRTGRHPEFGPVTLEQLLATWVAHDLGHLAQVSRVMAKQYGDAVGPWSAYLSVLGRRGG